MSKQGKGTADHLLPLGDWFIIRFTNAVSLTGYARTDRRTDQRTDPIIEMRGRIQKISNSTNLSFPLFIGQNKNGPSLMKRTDQWRFINEKKFQSKECQKGVSPISMRGEFPRYIFSLPSLWSLLFSLSFSLLSAFFSSVFLHRMKKKKKRKEKVRNFKAPRKSKVLGNEVSLSP